VSKASPVETKPIVGSCQPRTLPALTGLRAIAAYMVFWHHYLPPGGQPGVLTRILAEGHIGVTIFFVLSGFLIAYRYQASLSSSRTMLVQYLWNRAARIYPLYFAILVVTLLVEGGGGFWHWLLQITLLKGFFDDYKFTGISQAWSLTVEETFYLLAPLVFLLIRRHGMLAALLAAYAVGAACLVVGVHLDWHGLMGNFRFVALYTFFGRAFEFLIGVWLAMRLDRTPGTRRAGHNTGIVSKWGQAPRIKRPFAAFIHVCSEPVPILRRCRNTYLGFGGILAVAWVLYSLRRPDYALGLFHPAGMVLNNFVLPLAVVALLRGLIEEDTYLRRLLSTPLAGLLGKSSYAFYLLHLGVVASLIRHSVHGTTMTFLLLNVVAVLAYKGFEEPVNRWLRSLVSANRDQSRTRGTGIPSRSDIAMVAVGFNPRA
jgi:peptidoglycan/LPS O-acetylase OafA/YrhL